MPGYHQFQLAAPVQSGRVHPADAGAEGRVMHENQGRGIRPGAESPLQPSQPLRAQFSVMVTGHAGIESDEPNWIVIDHVVYER